MTQTASRTRALVIGVGLLIVFEGLLRVIVPEKDLLFAWEHPEGMVTLMGDSVWVRESSSQHGNDGPYTFEIKTNSDGMRDTVDHPQAKPANVDRYLALGDSWIFGTSVTQNATIPEHLERSLSSTTGRETVIMNAGIPGGSAFEMLARWTELKEKYELTGVVLGFPHNAGRQRELSGLRSSLFHPTAGAPYFDNRMYLVLRHLIAPYTRPRYAEASAADPMEDESLLIDLETLIRDIRSRGLSVTMIEDPGHMADALGSPRVLNERWRSEFEPHGVVFAGHALNTRDCWGFKDHGHPGESGTSVIATVVSRAMVQGQSLEQLQSEPTCAEVDWVGPGKPGWPVAE